MRGKSDINVFCWQKSLGTLNKYIISKAGNSWKAKPGCTLAIFVTATVAVIASKSIAIHRGRTRGDVAFGWFVGFGYKISSSWLILFPKLRCISIAVIATVLWDFTKTSRYQCHDGCLQIVFLSSFKLRIHL